MLIRGAELVFGTNRSRRENMKFRRRVLKAILLFYSCLSFRSALAGELLALGCDANQLVTAHFTCSHGWSPVERLETQCQGPAGMAMIQGGAVAVVRKADDSLEASTYSQEKWGQFTQIFAGQKSIWPVAVIQTSSGAYAAFSSNSILAGGRFDGIKWQENPDVIVNHRVGPPALAQIQNQLLIEFRDFGPRLWGSFLNGNVWGKPTEIADSDDFMLSYMFEANNSIGYELLAHDDHTHIYSFPGRVLLNESPQDSVGDFSAVKANDGALWVTYIEKASGQVYGRMQAKNGTSFGGRILIDSTSGTNQLVLSPGVCGDLAELVTVLVSGETHHFRLNGSGWSQIATLTGSIPYPSTVAIQ
jgi:hypothetical protein